MRNTATAIFFLFAASATLTACGPNDDNTVHHDLATGGDEGDMSVEEPADMRMQLPPDMTKVNRIQAVKNAADSSGSDGGALDLPLAGVIVTYVRLTPIGTDVAGFFVQEHMAGPAIFVGIDPASLSPAAAVGDTVSFSVTGATSVSKVRMVTGLTGWTRDAQGADVSTLVQDVSAKTDLVTAIDNYDSELIKISGTVGGNLGSSGTGFVQQSMTTAGITTVPATGPSMKLRLPTDLQDNNDIVQTCTFTLDKVPLWRFTTSAQPSAWVPADITLTACPAPQVQSAIAIDANTVRVKFTRNIKASTFVADGSQFTMNNGLTVSAATLSGRFVDLTTSAQTPGTTYTVTVANTIHDLLDVPLDAAHLTAMFPGFTVPAQLVINEVDPNIKSSLDLVELRVTSAGTTNGIVLQQGYSTKTKLATLPAIQVAVDDLIVVHLTPAATVTNETMTKTDCADAACYAGAWDVAGLAVGITYSNQVLTVIAADGTTHLDTVAFTLQSGSPGGFPGEVQAAQAAGQWMPADCTGTLCTYASTPTVEAISVPWVGSGGTAGNGVPTGPSAQRKGGTLVQTHSASDWGTAPLAQTFGAANAP